MKIDSLSNKLQTSKNVNSLEIFKIKLFSIIFASLN